MRKVALVALGASAVFAAAVAILRRGRPERPEPERPAPTEGVVSERSLDTLTRDELYELARERDIAGRSRMKKDELRDALRRA
jgi:hypothetical protein